LDQSYTSAKIRQLNELETFRVYGHGLDLDGDPSGASELRRGWKPVSPCFCVHDNPQNPCPCGPLVWWLRSDMIVGQGNAGKKDHEGKELQYFDVLVESKILVESVRAVSAGALKHLGGRLSPEKGKLGVADSGGRPPGSGTKSIIVPLIEILAGLTTAVLFSLANEPDVTEEDYANLCKKMPWLC
jgi:hypothetical protein